MWLKFVLMAPEGDSASAGASAAAPEASAAPAAAAAADGLTPPGSLVNNDPPAGETAPKDGEQSANKPAEKPAEKPADDKPIEYADFTLPEGVKLDDAKLGEFKTIAAEAKMPQEHAQKLVDLYAAEIKQVQEAPLRAWNDLQKQWREEVISDPEIGGANLDKNLATIKGGLNALLGEQAKSFFEALNVTGAGNNPAIVRGLLKAAAPHAPATPVDGNPGSGGKSAGAIMYPSMAGLGNGHKS